MYYQFLDRTFVAKQIIPQFVFNVDESGFVDFVDMHDELVIIPFDASDDTVKSAERNFILATMVGTISLDGTTLTPLIVLTNKRIQMQLLMTRYGQQNAFVVYQKSGIINLKVSRIGLNKFLFQN